jgi:hypothetical protein
MSPFAMRGFPVAAACLLGAATAGACLSGAASAAQRAPDAVLTMHAGGDRTTSANTITGGTVAGTAGVLFTVANASGTQAGRCTTVAGGTCTVDVANSQTYTVTQAAAPAGWFSSESLGVGTSTTLASANYSRVSVTVPADGGTISVPPAGPNSATNNAFRSGVWAVPRDNPPAPAGCGLDVALLFDLSGSVDPFLGQYRNAGVDFVQALAGTPSRVALYTFASGAPANTTNNSYISV